MGALGWGLSPLALVIVIAAIAVLQVAVDVALSHVEEAIDVPASGVEIGPVPE